MANYFSTNQTPTSHAQSMFLTISTMMAAGWNCLAWSDGTTAHLTGTVPGPYATGPSDADPIFPLTGTFPASGSATTDGLGNSRAWIMMRQPVGTGSVGYYTGKRMIVIQKGTNATHHDWRIKYSLTGGFIRGQANSGSTPAGAGDSVYICGGGTDATPTFSTIFLNTANGASRHVAMANDGLSGEQSPFGVYSVSWAAGGGGGTVGAHHMFMIDPLEVATNNPADVDPFAFYAEQSAGSPGALRSSNVTSTDPTKTYTNSNGAVSAWFRYGQAAASFENICGAVYFTWGASDNFIRQLVPGDGTAGQVIALGTNVHNGFDDFFPVPYVRRAGEGGNTGYKGVSSLVRWLGTARSIGDTFTLVTTRDMISLRAAVIPWDGSVPLV